MTPAVLCSVVTIAQAGAVSANMSELTRPAAEPLEVHLSAHDCLPRERLAAEPRPECPQQYELWWSFGSTLRLMFTFATGGCEDCDTRFVAQSWLIGDTIVVSVRDTVGSPWCGTNCEICLEYPRLPGDAYLVRLAYEAAYAADREKLGHLVGHVFISGRPTFVPTWVQRGRALPGEGEP